MRKLFLIYFSLCLFTQISCRSDKKEIDLTKIEGRWSLVSAERNGKQTGTLDKTFFNITDQSFSHNLNGDSIAVSFKVEGDLITFENDELLTEMDILELTQDTLKTSLQLGKFKFKFLMSKNESK